MALHTDPTVRLTSGERDRVLIRRPWRATERRVVWNGFLGRLLIAVEPIICSAVFAGIAIALIRANRPDAPPAILAPIFGLGFIAFTAYAVGLMVAPVRAFLHTFSPIFIVDGYVRHRRADAGSPPESNGYVAVLNENRRIIGEWPLFGPKPIADDVRPALIEFTYYGGIHRIDGRPTGVLPERLPALGVGRS